MKETNDLVSKNLEKFPDVAADILNALLYKGKEIITEGNLLSAPTETVYQGKDALHNQLEDLTMYEIPDGNMNAMYLLANQTTSDYRMLLRKAGYTGAVYREQYDGKIKELCPVIEIVLYWGQGRWRGSRSIRQLFGEKNLPKEAWDYIDNLKLHVWEMRRLPEETRECFQSDMRIVVDYLAEGSEYRSNRKVVHKEALIKMIRTLSGDRNVEDTADILEKMNVKEEDEITMCELFDQYTRKGISEGRKAGRKEGIQEGMNRGIKEGIKAGVEALIITCKELGVSFDETAEKVKLRFQLKDSEVNSNMAMYW